MNEAQAVVVRVEGERAWVRLRERAGGCGRCDEPGGCRSTGLAYALKAPNEIFCIPNSIHAHPGEAVRLRMLDGALLRGALMGYGMGACLLVVGAVVGAAFSDTGREDLFAALGAIAGLACAVAINRLAFRSRILRNGFAIEMQCGPVECGVMPERR